MWRLGFPVDPFTAYEQLNKMRGGVAGALAPTIGSGNSTLYPVPFILTLPFVPKNFSIFPPLCINTWHGLHIALLALNLVLKSNCSTQLNSYYTQESSRPP